MKVLALFLAILYLGLAFVPCSDGHVHEDGQAHSDHQHSDDEQDHCTPFCVCVCCGITYILPENQDYDFYAHPAHLKHRISGIDLYTCSYLYQVWHPPAHA